MTHHEETTCAAADACLARHQRHRSGRDADECAARLDQSIAIKTYVEAANWWAQVEREYNPERSEPATPDPSKPYMTIYGWVGDLEFCVMSEVLNIRTSPGGAIVGKLDKGAIFTVDLATQEEVAGYIWAKHDKGWSAIFPYSGDIPGRIVELTHPKSCPAPKQTPALPPAQRTTSRHEALQIGQTKTFHLSGADCAIIANRGAAIDPGKVTLAVGRLGWLKDEFKVDIFAPGRQSRLAYTETEVQDDEVGLYTHQLYTARSSITATELYTIEAATYTESKKYTLRVNSKGTFNIAVACE